MIGRTDRTDRTDRVEHESKLGRPLRILYVWPVARFSVWDVARGYRTALERIVGRENIRDYYLDRHTAYHRKALPTEAGNDVSVLSKYASESVLNEALYFNADLVIIVSGLNFHPIGLWLLNKVGIPAACLFTESPYNDDDQANWVTESYPGAFTMTNDKASADRFGWYYVPHSYDPRFHHPPASESVLPGSRCDVCIVGTGWEERQALLEAVNWDGINLKVYGVWPNLTSTSKLYPRHVNAVVDNEKIAPIYGAAKICINAHRSQGDRPAYSLGPRAYEIAACGAFQLSDYRPELVDVFADTVPVYKGAARLEELIRYYLDHDKDRADLAMMQRARVERCTFDDRAVDMYVQLDRYVAEHPGHTARRQAATAKAQDEARQETVGT